MHDKSRANEAVINSVTSVKLFHSKQGRRLKAHIDTGCNVLTRIATCWDEVYSWNNAMSRDLHFSWFWDAGVISRDPIVHKPLSYPADAQISVHWSFVYRHKSINKLVVLNKPVIEATGHQWFMATLTPTLAPVPLSIFRSNSKFDENSKHSSVKYTRPITTTFCTRHDSVTRN